LSTMNPPYGDSECLGVVVEETGAAPTTVEVDPALLAVNDVGLKPLFEFRIPEVVLGWPGLLEGALKAGWKVDVMVPGAVVDALAAVPNGLVNTELFPLGTAETFVKFESSAVENWVFETEVATPWLGNPNGLSIEAPGVAFDEVP
jgi:hypothetical protein